MTTPAAAQTPPPADSLAVGDTGGEVPAETIGQIRVQGNVAVDSARIVRTFEVPPGTRYAQEAVSRGIRKLFALGLFEDVTVDRVPHDGVVDLVIHVRERPRIAAIHFSGNEKKKTEELQKKLFLHVGETYSPTTAAMQVDTLLKFYHDEGYPRVAIDAVPDTVRGGSAVNLKFVVQEGEKLRIRLVRFEGAHAFTVKKLRHVMKTHAKNFFGGGEIKDETFAEDVDRLESFYHDRGYRDMKVTDHRLDPQADPKRLTLTLVVDEGPRYRIGTVRWTGATQVPMDELAKQYPGKVAGIYDHSKIERATQGGYAAYAERGYLYVAIEPRETVRDSNVVDVELAVTENKPSHVRYITITGNHATREHVIRRELAIHEGDLFRRSGLVRSQEALQRLGLFTDVTPDFQAAESTDVDLTFKVNEKQVGTASAGAGYTADAGLTGFVELGHNNVLGNGQSLNIHLERGSSSNNYNVSFTEPWFRGTPTLLGMSAFNTALDRDLYREERRGASGRIGRPLGWPSFTRGSLGYSLEDVEIKALNGQTTLSGLPVADSIALVGIPVGKPQRTSSATTSLIRNTTNNAFYPTKGTSQTLDDEFAGGAFGGAVNYHKHRLEGRWYFPSFVKGVTTMVRARVGLLAGYQGQTLDVPPYERFRLGGGSVPDPLRGYDDYQVVPEKFIRKVITRTISKIDTVGGLPDTLYNFSTQTVRYPGGKTMELFTVEQQFPIAGPLHGVLFFDAGNTWDQWREIQPLRLKIGAGIGFRMEIPLLGNIGFDYGYGFNRDDGPHAKGHFLLGNVNF
jgi:outer membrane protein insertion porin family